MKEKIIEHVFFFGLLALATYLVWQIIYPFVSALVLSSIVATVCYPFYLRILNWIPGKRRSLAAFLATLIVFLIVIIPLGVIGYLLFLEAATFYVSLSTGATLSLSGPLHFVEELISRYLPNFSMNLTQYAQQGAGWLASSIGAVFASAASTALLLFIAFVGLYYLFRDGARLVRTMIRLSPLPDSADVEIIGKLTRSVRSVVLGSLAVGLIQGTLTAIGFTIFGVPQAVLWGTVAAIAALIPAVGTSLVIIPGIIFLIISGDYISATGLAVWGVVIVGLVDNVVGPHLVSRGSTLHPFLVLLSALGGLSLFGPIGFILGPVIMSFFIALLSLYETHISVRENNKEHAG